MIKHTSKILLATFAILTLSLGLCSCASDESTSSHTADNKTTPDGTTATDGDLNKSEDTADLTLDVEPLNDNSGVRGDAATTRDNIVHSDGDIDETPVDSDALTLDTRIRLDTTPFNICKAMCAAWKDKKCKNLALCLESCPKWKELHSLKKISNALSCIADDTSGDSAMCGNCINSAFSQ